MVRFWSAFIFLMMISSYVSSVPLYVTNFKDKDSAFVLPVSICLDNDSGRLYMTEPANRRVYAFDNVGRRLATFDAVDNFVNDNDFLMPSGIAFNKNIGPNGTLYVSDYISATITALEFDSTQGIINLIKVMDTIGRPGALAVFPPDKILVADMNGHDGLGSIRLFTKDGDVVDNFGINGEIPQPMLSDGMSVTDKVIFVANERDHLIISFNHNGRTYILPPYGKEGSGPGEFNFPVDITGMSATTNPYTGHIMVADYGNNRIQTLSYDVQSQNIKFHSQFSSDENGKLVWPTSIVVNPNTGQIYVLERIIGRISVLFDPEEWVLPGHSKFIAPIHLNQTLNMKSGYHLESPKIVIKQTGDINGTGEITGDVYNNGLLAPESIKINGNYCQSDTGTLRANLSCSPCLIVSGQVELSGNLNIQSVGNSDELGSRYQIVTASYISGKFTNINHSIQNCSFKMKYSNNGVFAYLVPSSFDLVSPKDMIREVNVISNDMLDLMKRPYDLGNGPWVRYIGGWHKNGNESGSLSNASTGYTHGNDAGALAVYMGLSAASHPDFGISNKFIGTSSKIKFTNIFLFSSFIFGLSDSHYHYPMPFNGKYLNTKGNTTGSNYSTEIGIGYQYDYNDWSIEPSFTIRDNRNKLSPYYLSITPRFGEVIGKNQSSSFQKISSVSLSRRHNNIIIGAGISYVEKLIKNSKIDCYMSYDGNKYNVKVPNINRSYISYSANLGVSFLPFILSVNIQHNKGKRFRSDIIGVSGRILM